MKSIDSKSKELFISILKSKGYTQIEESPEFSYWDLQAVSPKGEKWRFELKVRNLNSKRYGDAIMEEHKYKCFTRDRNEFKYGALVTFFKDKWVMSNVFSPTYFNRILAAHTTSFADNNVITKYMVHYTFHKEYNYSEG